MGYVISIKYLDDRNNIGGGTIGLGTLGYDRIVGSRDGVGKGN